MPGFIGFGALVASADSVATPTSLVPPLPATRSTGDWLFCFTACTSAAATVATPSGWQSVANVTGTNGRMVLFARKVAGGEANPTVTWSSLTTGTSGSPCDAHITNMGTGFKEVAGLLQVEVLGSVSNQASSATVVAGGTGITTSNDPTYVFAMGVRQDDAASSITDAGTGLVWGGLNGDQTTSGIDMLTALSWGTKSPAGAIGDHTWVLTGGVAAVSSGVMLALLPVPPVTMTLSATVAVSAVREFGQGDLVPVLDYTKAQ